ncbi:predicted protein [Naegleria gruberi]|uniref:Predicted protein n=1 Tax=Naegleria gruberi TaxID=5762 RepID=D2W2V4_NAEGR|nr:uncharacterized protein NAEGRDRAFT_75725 [Naegleria gruberi]EFC36581.1 predicted protein [Naegleria gruberi]|eukprot:XP_002669325.1 predicted protein [Naegleria gruberi strain NEG-M]
MSNNHPLNLFSADLYSSDEDEDLIQNGGDQHGSMMMRMENGGALDRSFGRGGGQPQQSTSHLNQLNDSSFVSVASTGGASSSLSVGTPARNTVRSTDANNDEDEEALENETPVILSLCYQRGRLGVAAFDMNSGELLCGETNENTLFEATEFVKFEVKPNLILVPSRLEQSFMKHVKKPIEGAKEQQIEVKLLKSSDFSAENATKKIQLLENVLLGNQNDRMMTDEEPSTPILNNGPAFLKQANRLRQVSEKNDNMFDFSSLYVEENTQTVRALGGLLCHIQTNRLSFGELDDIEVLKNIKNIKNFKLFSNQNSHAHVVTVESHPSSSLGKPKEGLSLFGIMNKTKSSVGKDLLRQWFLKPVMDLDIIKKRHDAIDYFSRFSDDIIDEIRENLKFVKNTKRIINRMREAKATVNDWSNLYKTLYCYKNITEILSEMDDNPSVEVAQDLLNHDNESIMKVLQAISKIVDLKESRSQNRLVIMTGVNSELDNRRQTYESLDTFLDLVAQQESNSFPEDFPFSFKAVYYPQLGFLLVVDKNETSENYSEYAQYGLRFHFSSDRSLYFKNDTTDELDTEVGDIHHLIIEQETSISVKLEKYVLQYHDQINKSNDLCAKLDCIISMANCASEFNLSRPVMTNESKLNIREGKNILQELTVDTFIPNDTNISECIQIITGPNNSGKSCYLKQVGLIVFMAHIGSFVSASPESVIGVVDRIMTRIQSQDSISVSQSTFAIDVLQMKAMVDFASSRSLLLIDEFGKGTLALDGIALLSAILKHFQEREHVPRVIVTTHYVEVLQHKIIDVNSTSIQFMTMDVLIDSVNELPNDMEDEHFVVPSAEDLVFLYKLTRGKIIPSYGITVASLAGLPNQIIERAKFVAERLSKSKPIEAVKDNEKGKLFYELYDRFRKCDGSEESIKQLFNFVKSI